MGDSVPHWRVAALERRPRGLNAGDQDVFITEAAKKLNKGPHYYVFITVCFFITPLLSGSMYIWTLLNQLNRSCNYNGKWSKLWSTNRFSASPLSNNDCFHSLLYGDVSWVVFFDTDITRMTTSGNQSNWKCSGHESDQCHSLCLSDEWASVKTSQICYVIHVQFSIFHLWDQARHIFATIPRLSNNKAI